MSRAYNIHIVLSHGNVLAAFTVKHELEAWLARAQLTDYKIVTVKDNPDISGAPHKERLFGEHIRETITALRPLWKK